MKKQIKIIGKHTFEQTRAKLINRNTLNNSSSKQLPFFSKAERFPKLKPSTQLSERSRTESQSSTARLNKFPTIPQAERVLYFDQQKQLCLHPSPQAYHVKSQDQLCKITHRGGTMGVRFNSLAKARQSTPSAVQYQNQIIQVKKSFNRSFTFERSQRNLMKLMTKRGKDSPGPKYDIGLKPRLKPLLNFQVKGKKKEKKERNKTNRVKLSSIQHTNRFSTVNLEKHSPQPKQQSSERPQRLQRGKSIKRNLGFSTTQRIRMHSLPQQNPGPGTYVFFSQFSGWM